MSVQVHHYNKHAAVRGGCWQWGRGRGKRETSVPSSQFCSEPKTVLKKNLQLFVGSAIDEKRKPRLRLGAACFLKITVTTEII